MAAIIVETPPADEPISLTQAKSACRIYTDIDDTIVQTYISAAREKCELFTARSFVAKGYCQYLDAFPYYTDTIFSQQAYPPSYYSLPRYATTMWNYSQMIKLMVSPLISASHINYLDSQTQKWTALVPGYPRWYPLTSQNVGDVITDSNGTMQTCTAIGGSPAVGLTGQAEPTWPTVSGQTVVDGTLTWTCSGLAAPIANFIVDGATEPPRIFPQQGMYWPSVMYVPNSVQIHFTAGPPANPWWMNVALVAMLQCISDWYENREAVSALPMKDIPNKAKELLWNIRVIDAQATRG
jgi:hypothetical protein